MSSTSVPLNEQETLISSYLLKRNKSHNWQKRWLVLRRNQLSYYKDSKEYKASKVISIDEILSFSEIPDNHDFHFIIVTSPRIYHFKALDGQTYRKWIDVLDSLINLKTDDEQPQQLQQQQLQSPKIILEHDIGSDEDSDGIFKYAKPKLPNQTIDYLGDELQNLQFSGTDDNFTSGGGLSDSGSRNHSKTSLQDVFIPNLPEPIPEEEIEDEFTQEDKQNRQLYNSLASTTPQHIIGKGHLYRLKKRYNQWKKYYIILTNHYLFFFKSIKDYESDKLYKVIKVEEILDAVELDPMSRSKIYCMLIVTPKKRIRFCAENEEELTKWLVLLKTLIKTRKQEKLRNN